MRDPHKGAREDHRVREGGTQNEESVLAAANPFVFGVFTVYEGRDAYTLVQAEIQNYFMELREDFVGTCYGCYFMEVAAYYTRENLDAAQVLNLLYATLRALTKKEPDNELIRCIFEMKMMVLNGEYPYEVTEDTSLQEATRYALAYVIHSPIGRLYTFTLKPEVFREFRHLQDRFNRLSIDREFKSLDILKTMVET